MHTDQASTLRLIVNNAEKTGKKGSAAPRAARQKPRTIAVTGGKGGVGKSNVALNLALALASLDRKVTLLDADFGLANIDILCGRNGRFHLGHVVSGQLDLTDIAVDLPGGVRLIPGGSGLEELANLAPGKHARLFADLRETEAHADFFIVDTAAGIAANVSSVLLAAAEVVVVTTPEPTALVDAYATMKLVNRHAPEKTLSLIVNNVVNLSDAEGIYQQLNAATERFFKQKLNFLGAIPYDFQLQEAVREQMPLLEYAPNAPASRALRLIARQINEQTPKMPAPVNAKSFWQLISQTPI